MFPSRFLDGHPDPAMWHGACRVTQGAKFTLQKFKEIPRVNGEWIMDPDWTMENGSQRPAKWVPLKPK